jgi:hypothetical protein
MRLHGRLRHAELVGDLLVEQVPPDSIISTRTCCGVSVDSRAIMAALSASGRPREIDVGRRPHFALQHARDRLAQRLDAERLRNEARGAEFHAAADHGGIVIGRDHDDRQARILRAQIHQAGKAAHAGHAQIEQDQIDIAAALQKLGDFLEGAGFADIGAQSNSPLTASRSAPRNSG